MSYATTVDGEAGLSPEGVKHLQERGLSDTTAKALGVYESSSRSSKCLVFPYLKDGKVVNNKYRTFDKKFSTDAGGEQVAWNRQCLQDPTLMKEPLIITEGELDALTAIQCGFKRTVSCPFGAPSQSIDVDRDDVSNKYAFVRDMLPLLEECTEIILAVDGDGNGQVLRDDLAVRLGRTRCKFVQYPKGCKDLNDALMAYGAKGVEATVERAKWFPVEGVFAFSDLPKAEEKPVYELGMGSFDNHFKLRRGDFSVFTGVPSSGKSTFLNHVMCKLAVKHRLRLCFASFEQSPQTDHLRALRKWYLWEFHKQAMPPKWEQVSEDRQNGCASWIDQHFRVIHPSWEDAVNLEWLIERLQVAVIQHDCDVLIIDPFNEMEHNTEGESMTLYIGFFIKTLKRFAVKNNIHLIVVAHPRKVNKDKDGNVEIPTLYDIEQSAMWYNKCDLGVIIHRQAGVTMARTAKSRYEDVIGKRGQVLFTYDEETAHFYEYEEEL